MNNSRDKKVREYFTDTLVGYSYWAKLAKPTVESNPKYKPKYIIHLKLVDDDGNPVIHEGENQLEKAERLGLTIHDKNDDQGKFVKIKRDYLDRDGKPRPAVPTARKDENGNDIAVKVVPNESLVKVMASFWRYDEDSYKTTTFMMGVLVKELAEMESKLDEDFNFAFNSETPEKPTSSDVMDAQAPAEAPSEPAFDDEIPF